MNAARIAASNSAENGCASTMARICAPTLAKSRTSSVLSAFSKALILSSKPPSFKNSRKAWAVVANPVGTRTPVGSCEIISPKLAFLPPTDSTSAFLRFSNGTTSAVGLKSVDMGKLQKLKPMRTALLQRARSCKLTQKSAFVVGFVA